MQDVDQCEHSFVLQSQILSKEWMMDQASTLNSLGESYCL